MSKIIAFYDPAQYAHDPVHFLSTGRVASNPEKPERITHLLNGLKKLNIEPMKSKDFGLGPIARVHSSEYIEFLKTIYKRWQEAPDTSSEVIPNIHPNKHGASYPKAAIGQAGYHMADTACPISADTFEAVYWSAQTAINTAQSVIDGNKIAYGLCRPPGHHAFTDVAGGFCFFNNSAVAAAHTTSNGLRTAIVDVDLHHGNGTQGIFYDTSDVLTVSIHADPSHFYPFFWGHADERGEGKGLGANLNLPLALGAGDNEFLAALDVALDRVKSFGADIVIIALGLDAFEGDPFAGLAVSTEGFSQIAAKFAKLDLPLVVIQEGGYICPELGDNLHSFLTGLRAE